MMTNRPSLVTSTGRRIAWQLDDIAPQPGCSLVIFEGGTFWEVVPAGGKFQLPFSEKLLRRRQFIGYAVTSESQVEHEVSFPCESKDHLGPLHIHAELYFAVTNPRRVVESLATDATDPLQRVVAELKRLTQRVVRRLTWSDLVEGGIDIEQTTLTSVTLDDNGERLPVLELLQHFATRLGLTLKLLRLTSSLPTPEVEVLVAGRKKVLAGRVSEAETAQEKENAKRAAELKVAQENAGARVDQAVNERAKQQEELAKELDRLRGEREQWQADHQRQLEVVNQERLAIQGRAKWFDELSTRVVTAMGTAMDTMAGRMETPQQLIAAIQAFQELKRQSLIFMPGTSTDLQSIEGSPTPQLLTAATGPRGRLVRRITELLDLTARLPGDGEQPRRVTSIGLHLLAESLLGEAADPSLLNRFQRDLEYEFESLAAGGMLPSDEHRMTLQRLRDIQALKSDLQ